MAQTRLFHDPLTNAPNQAYFDEQLKLMIGLANRSQSRLCVCIAHLDTLPALQAQQGEAAAEAMLQAIDQQLRQSLRSSDFIARTGNNVFSLILPHIDSMAGLERVASKLLAAISSPAILPGVAEPASVRASLGMALCPDDATTAADLCRLAEAAMLTAQSGQTGWSLP